MHPYKPDDPTVHAILQSLRLATWMCYLAIEIAYPSTREPNRYWKLRTVDGKTVVEYAPSEDQLKKDAVFLQIPGVGEDELSAEADVPDSPAPSGA